MNAALEVIKNPPEVRTIAITAPKAAPDDIPTRPGSANGFRNSACMVAPVTANAAPLRHANKTRGTRISIKIREISSSSEVVTPNNSVINFDTGIEIAPPELAPTMVTINESISTVYVCLGVDLKALEEKTFMA